MDAAVAMVNDTLMGYLHFSAAAHGIVALAAAQRRDVTNAELEALRDQRRLMISDLNARRLGCRAGESA